MKMLQSVGALLVFTTVLSCFVPKELQSQDKKNLQETLEELAEDAAKGYV